MLGDEKSRIYITPFGKKLFHQFPEVYTEKDYFRYADAVEQLIHIWLHPDGQPKIMDMRALGFNTACSEHPFIFAYVSEMVRFSRALFYLSEQIQSSVAPTDEITGLCLSPVIEMMQTLSHLSAKYMPHLNSMSPFNAKLCLESHGLVA